MRLGQKQFWVGVLAMGLALPAFAGHGRLATADRDGWINLEAADLVSAGLVAQPDKPIAQMTNLEVAQLTAQAAHSLYAQVQLPPPLPGGDVTLPPAELPPPGTPGSSALPGTASKSLMDLVEEFRTELAAMGTDVDKLEARIQDAKDRDEAFADLQQEYLKRTGTEVGGFSRGYFFNYRGFGNSPLPAMDYNALMFMEMDLRSVPVPFLLFDARVRTIRSIGMYYADPISPHYELRWLQLSNFNDVCSLTAGDFFKSYTPLTLWNYEVPVYTFIEPTPFYRTRKDVEEWVYMDHGPDEHLRGFQAATTVAFDKDPFLSHFKLQAMAGPMNTATAFTYGSYFAGTQGSFSFLNDNVELGATGLLLWQDPSSANVPYIPDFANTWAHQYEIGSITERVTIPFADKVDLTASMENAASQYNDDARVPQRVFNDWALVANGSLDIEGVHVTGKYLNVGPYYYAPGAQTNRVLIPGAASNLLDDSLAGYLLNTPFQGVFRPSFALYDRLAENALPYGDSTPNREGIVLGFSGEIGDKGWLKPQFSFESLQEMQPNFVLKPDGSGLVAVDSDTNTAAARAFTGFEGALTIDIAKAADMPGRTYDIQFDFKNQATDLGLGGDPFTVNTIIAACDFNIPAHFLNTVVWSVAFEQVQSTGNEYVIGSVPPFYGEYPFMLDTSMLGKYTYTALNLTEQTFAFGFKLPLNDIANFRGDYFLTNYNWSDQPGYSRDDQIWRFGYYVKF